MTPESITAYMEKSNTFPPKIYPSPHGHDMRSVREAKAAHWQAELGRIVTKVFCRAF